jgi:hypothetical protein
MAPHVDPASRPNRCRKQKGDTTLFFPSKGPPPDGQEFGIRTLFKAGAKGAESGGKRRQIRSTNIWLTDQIRTVLSPYVTAV